MSTASTVIASAAVATALAVAGYVGLQSSGLNAKIEPKPAAGKPAPRIVRTTSPEAAPEKFALSLPGRTAPFVQATISTRATGIVADRRADIGDFVNEGDVLAVIDAPEIEQEYARAKAAVEQGKARAALARSNVERAEALIGKNHISMQVLDERKASFKTAEADIDAAEAEVRRLEEVRRFQIVKAPFAGTVISRQVERGDKVSADQGATSAYLFRLARLDELRVEIDVPQSVALSIKPGTSASITFAELPGKSFEAKVARVSGLIDTQSSTMRAELLMPNPDRAIPAGLNGQVSLDVVRVSPAVMVPPNTLVIREGRQSVGVVDGDGKFTYRLVTVGRDLGEKIEIVSGLATSDRVVLSPNALLKSGDKVEVAIPAAASAKPASAAR